MFIKHPYLSLFTVFFIIIEINIVKYCLWTVWKWTQLSLFWLQTWSMTVWPSQIRLKLQSIKHAMRTGSKARKECQLNSCLVFSPWSAVAGRVCTADYTSAMGRWRNVSLEWKKVRPRDQEVGLLASNSLCRLWACAHTKRRGVAAFLSGGLKRELGADVAFTCQSSVWVWLSHSNGMLIIIQIFYWLHSSVRINNPTRVCYRIRSFLHACIPVNMISIISLKISNIRMCSGQCLTWE